MHTRNVGSDANWASAECDEGAFAAAGASGREACVPRVKSPAEDPVLRIRALGRQRGLPTTTAYHHGLGDIRLAEQHGPHVEEEADESRVCRRNMACIGPQTKRRGNALDLETLLYTNRKSMQRAESLALQSLGVRIAGSVEGLVEEDLGEAVGLWCK